MAMCSVRLRQVSGLARLSCRSRSSVPAGEAVRLGADSPVVGRAGFDASIRAGLECSSASKGLTSLDGKGIDSAEREGRGDSKSVHDTHAQLLRRPYLDLQGG